VNGRLSRRRFWDPKQTSISTRKPDMLRSRGVFNRPGTWIDDAKSFSEAIYPSDYMRGELQFVTGVARPGGPSGCFSSHCEGSLQC
jgi:hypothetical protein